MSITQNIMRMTGGSPLHQLKPTYSIIIVAFVILKFLIKYEQQEQGFCELCCNFVR